MTGNYLGFVEANGFGFCSGIVGVDEGGLVLEKLEAQVQVALGLLMALLEEYDLDQRSVVKTVVYIAHESDYEKVDALYRQTFTESMPANTVLVAKLPKKKDQGPNEILFALDATVTMTQFEE